MTRKEIYAAYGINYEDGKIESPVFGFIQPLLVNGNAKLGKGVWTFSTLAGTDLYSFDHNGTEYTCNGTCPCDCKGCYAKTGNYRFKSTVKSLGIKTVLSKSYPQFVENAIKAQIAADNINLVRIHAAGDFIGTEYITVWRNIAKAFPRCLFWTYTKNAAAENAFNDLDNVNVVKSIIPCVGLNFGHCDYILDTYKKLCAAGETVYICRCGVDKNQHCTNCKGCSVNKYVLFIEHSTGYNAETDPVFPVLKALIESQAKQ